MSRIVLSAALAAAALAGIVAYAVQASGQTDSKAAPVFGITLPPDYRTWSLISVAREEGTLDDLRAILGNDIAMEAARAKALPYPDGAILARLAWSHEPLAESEKAFGRPQSFVAGAPKNGVQFMVKDSKRFASTGGWGFAQFDDGKPADPAMHTACFACHEVVRARDYVFNRYAP